jgi:hypothetical protein
MNLMYNNVRIVLGQQEQIFISKIMMLLNREKYKGDTVFWGQINSQRQEVTSQIAETAAPSI